MLVEVRVYVRERLTREVAFSPPTEGALITIVAELLRKTVTQFGSSDGVTVQVEHKLN